MRQVLVALIILSHFQLLSQHLAAFNDNLNQFWVFEAGHFEKLEHLEIQEYQVGGTLVAYFDNGSNLKVYQYGEVKTLLSGSPIKFQATDYLLGYSMYEQLNVYDNGDIKTLSTECDGYEIRDSLIGWHNRISHTIQVYYNKNVYTIEDGLIYNPLQEFELGDNTIAYIQKSTKEFKIFYQGEIFVLDQFAEDLRFEAGRDIVAYIDIPDQAFKVFFKGEEIELETFLPRSFHAGDEMLAWVDNLGRLKYFAGGDIIELSSYEPKFYDLNDNVLVFEEQGFFKTYCNGQVQVIERYIPKPYRIDFNTIAYLDQSSFVKIYHGCESKTISYAKVTEIDLIRDLIIFTEGINKINIYFNGQVYKH
ncbi:MAG: hypothetical protein K8S16_00375 [Bacteroidales bacterium]|nr:hypothetical protein [Bacteroidales bacterium]